jgi:hypothetical protein
MFTRSRNPGKVGVVVATPVAAGVRTQQWIRDAVVPPSRSENVNISVNVWAVESKMTSVNHCPGDRVQRGFAGTRQSRNI